MNVINFNKHKITKSLILMFLFTFIILIYKTSSSKDAEQKDIKEQLVIQGGYSSNDRMDPKFLEELNKQIEKSPQSFVKYAPDGHLYTTFIIAQLLGFDRERSLRLSYFSQLPDEEWRFEATTGGILYLPRPEMREKILSTLHSLHGGDQQAVNNRRNGLYHILKDYIAEDKPQDWKIGIILHAYADSFAHTYEQAGQEVAYNYGVGHLWHGHKPDTIALYPEKYKNYVAQLFDLLGQGKKQKEILSSFYYFIDQLSKDRNQALYQFNGLANFLGYNKEDCNKIGATTINENKITNDDVIRLLDTVEDKLGISKEKAEILAGRP